MANTARFLYVQQNKNTLEGPYIVHARKPHCILEMLKAKNYIGDSKVASFKVIKAIDTMDADSIHKIENAASKWYFSVRSQGLLEPWPFVL